MNKRKLYIGVFLISVLGLALVQYQYLKVGLNLARVQFNEKIGDASKQIRSGLNDKSQLTVLLEKAIIKDSSYFKLSIDSLQDATRYFLKDFITEQLVQQGITTDFDFRLYTKDTLYYLRSETNISEDTDEIIRYPIIIEGYLPAKLKGKTVLELHFQNLNKYFLSQLNGLIIPGILFMLAIIAVVVWVLRSFYWQRNVITTTNEFINNLTHELKTPVFAIGVAARILEEEVSEKKKPVLAIIKQQVQKLNDHTDKVLELSKLERRNNVFNLRYLDLKLLLKEVCDDFKLLSGMEEIDFTYTLGEGSFMVKADAFHLANAINNLLDNAKKYSKEKPKIQLCAERSRGNIIIRIKDHGIGIDKEHLSLIFKKFYRVSNGDTHNVKGYGLGLSYVKKVISGHCGSIEIKSEKNKGTLFTIALKALE
jgi:two-component system phosphate regulon sensor histidine kinase PhoR